ncbi:YitT family protein [Roseomonas populi]|uniref:YitT family protein n=1 Tax=Roseomonas populi TaxID=3121582 RepID=A0ABT1X4X5_9PROT|nr:YitT family protein [Roseomonas pecuniae]MCR0981994.1 YitT family protein [Roseomonas pecuniae]
MARPIALPPHQSERTVPLSPSPHRLYEDAAALLLGTFMVSLGLVLYGEARLVTSGLAGLALLLGYVTPLNAGTLFFLLNLPFLVFGLWRMGWRVLLRTLVAIGAVSLLTRFAPLWVDMQHVSPFYGALMGGILIGMGALALVRHRTGLGGTNLVAMHLQEKRGWRAGYVQLGFDVLVMLAACTVLDPQQVGLSMFGAVVVNLIVAMNHKPGRYLGVS